MRIYILGICGTFMSGIAQLAKEKGYEVSGCDENIYPPMNEILENLNINIDKGYQENFYSKAVDLYIVGNVISRGNSLMEKILDENGSFTSGPEFLFNHLLKDRHVVSIAGTHGKTTTSAMIAKIFIDSGKDVGYLIAGKVKDFSTSARVGTDNIFIIESDEYDTAFFDKRSKFIHYRPSTLLINNLEFDHADIFENLEEIQKQFHHLIRALPKKVKVLFPINDENISDLFNKGIYSIPVPFNFEYSEKGWSIKIEEEKTSTFQILFNGKLQSEISLKVFGEHNIRNAFAAYVTAASLGVKKEFINQSLSKFSGIERRMDFLGEKNSVYVYDDFAHHPTAIKFSLKALRNKDPRKKIVCLLEMRSNTMSKGFHDNLIVDSLVDADEVYLFSENKEQLRKLASQKKEINFCDTTEDFIEILNSKVYENTNIICFSNGSFDGIQSKIIENL